MCDYSLHLAASRPGELAEIIEIKEFSDTRTRGFESPSDPGEGRVPSSGRGDRL